MQTYPTGYAESHRIAEQIFREILPRHGMAVREEQIALCHEILDTLYNKEISLCEAGVGIGKTLAYLVACILWQMHRPSQLKMPVVISTSSVALQDAILNEYLPDLSAIMLAEGIITAPITAVVRKGKERFVCDARLAERQEKAISKGKRQKNSLRMAESILDLDHIPNLTRYDRCRICVPQSCPRDCFLRLDCRYQQYLRDSMKPDIQICNHNYLLANASHRLEERPLLLRQYQVLVVDEAHKLPDAARQMYTETLSAQDMDDLCSLLQQAHFKGLSKRLRTAFLTLSISCTPRFAMPKRKISVPFSLTPFRQAALADCISLLQYIGSQPDMPHYLQYRLAETESLLRLFLLDVPTRILYLEFSADGQLTFCAASNRVPQLLRSALWNTREPTILTSGTLTAAGDFDHTEQLLGLAAYAPLRHFRAESPFNYRKKCLLYIPARRAAAVPENQYLADKIVQLVSTCHGHALVLFTSYRQMRNVYDALGGRLMFPVFQAGRGQNRSIQQFKQSGNGVLFAAGSCWEGIDFPSDMVSLLIIAKLPFPIPDPVSDYERRQYPNLRDYINAEIIPEMQKKLRQGFGRAIRTEQDSCVVAILDERAGIGGKYHDAALAALPTCPTTEKIEDVLTGVSKKNTGQLPQYYIENNHEGIVTKQTFREAQAEIARRNSKSATNHRKRHRGRYNSKYALSERLVCGDCGSSYKRVTWSIHGRKQIVWRCVNRLEYGTKFCSNSPSIPETELHQAILKAVQNLAAKFTGEVADQLNGILHQIEVGESLTPQLQAQLEQNQQEFDHLLEMSLDFDENTPFLDDKLKRLSDKIKQLKTAITQSSVNSQTPSTPTNPITAKDLLITEYDDMLTARIIEKIIVKSRQDLEIIFIGGYTQQISLQ